MSAVVVSVNVGRPRVVEWYGREVTTAIFKEPVAGRVLASDVNLAGDEQADRRVHGGRDKAVYAYAVEDYRWWSERLGRELGPGTFGDNLTTAGLDLTTSAIGDRWRVGGTLLEVAQPREPCFKLGIRMGDAAFVDRFAEARRPGAYLRIVEPGDLAAGDRISVIPADGPTLRLVELVGDATPDVLRRIADDERVPDGWRRAARRALRGAGTS
ncbi:MAG TPA: MOSC domain-containing protein [Acidimicrobiia bacterium]|nr:MOSC domain-containing protein [Acidimicrobiia bacterium]